MGQRLHPFAMIAGRLYLVVNYNIEPRTRPALRAALARLLKERDSEEVLLLRALTRAESRLARWTVDEAAIDAWAQVVGRAEHRRRRR